jgi:hypothetical protein
MFNITEIKLGTVKVGIPVLLEYPYTDVGLVTKIVSPCDCSEVYNKAKEQMIVIKYTPKPIPEHLKAVGQYKVAKSATITYNGTAPEAPEMIQTLTFEAIVKK